MDEGGPTAWDLLLHDLTQDMETRLSEFYGEALAPVLIKAMSELAAETALRFFHMDEHMEAFKFAEGASSGAG